MNQWPYPEKNRRARTLDVLQLEVEDRSGVQTFDPNGIVLWQLEGGCRTLQPFELQPDIHSIHADTVLYRSHNLEVRLTPQQLDRLIRLALKPLEYFQLREIFGMAHEWHEDFYDPETGEALQARIARL